jgi:glycolate oxidase iron-sulfur subunit
MSSGALGHLDACLGCRACETACPSGVEYAHILEHFREGIENYGGRPSSQSFARRQLLNTLTSPSRLALSLKAAGVLEPLLKGKLPGFAATLLTGTPDVEVLMPARPKRVSVGSIPEVSRAIGEKRFTVGVLAGCVMRVLFHETNLATVRVLQVNGCDVISPRAAGCCGALHVHAGFADEAKAKARAVIDACDPYNLDAFVVNSAGCGSALKEYGDLLAGDPAYASRAAFFASRVKDVSEYLVQIGLEKPEGHFDATVAYHDACHLAHGQRITSQPRELLRAIPGLKLVEIPESDTCCGSAGIYNLTQPEMAKRLLERKVEFIANSGATVVATGNPGCLAWIKQGLADRGIEIDVKHPVEILDAAYGSAGQ